MRKGTQNKIIGVETVGPFTLDAFNLGIAQAWLDGADDTQGDVVLKCEDIFEPAIVTFGPQMSTSFGIDELGTDPHAVSCPADASLQHIAHAQLAADALHVHRLSLVGEARIARDDEQPLDARQAR